MECLKLLSQFQQKKLVFFLLFKTITCLKGKALFIAGLALGLSKSFFFPIIVNFSFTITHQYTRKAVAFSLYYREKIKVFLGIFQNKIAMKLTKKKYSDENQMPAFGSRIFVLAAPRKPHATQSSLDVRSFYLWLCRFILIFSFLFLIPLSLSISLLIIFFTCSHKLIKPAKDIKNCLAHRITQNH